MRNQVAIAVGVLAAALLVCFFIARRSRKGIASSVSLLLLGLLPPVAGNLIIILSDQKIVSIFGCYIYFLGMDLVMFALLQFTLVYCRLSWPSSLVRNIIYVLLIVDFCQLLCNPFFHHAFDVERTMVDGAAYFRVIPYLGQTFHRVVDYGIFFGVLIVFFKKMIHSPRIYFERYSVIFFVMAITGVWETYYIFSRTPVDKSMIGFGVFGLLVFYFALYYRPMRLLDSILANIVQEMPAAIYFFDAIGRCVWANDEGIALVGIVDEDFEQGGEKLERLFGSLEEGQKTLGTGEDEIIYTLSTRKVKDGNGEEIGYYLSVRNDTDQQQELMREKYNATHDRLTGLYTKEHLFDLIRQEITSHPDDPFLIGYMDVNDFKIVNDMFGSAFGDEVLKRIAETIHNVLPEGSLYGRLSGDTFGMCIPGKRYDEEVANEVLSSFSVKNDSIEHHLMVHLGVYEVEDRDMEISVMFDRAHMALDTIKSEYRRHVVWYDKAMREEVLWSQQITLQLPAALEEGQILPYLQVLVDSEGKVVGAEALVRWIHPEFGFLSPASFIPVFEQNGMIADVDRHMWRCACRTLARWEKEGHEELFISINVSPKDFCFMDVTEELLAATNEYGVPPYRLRVEITETVMMSDDEDRLQTLRKLRAAGFLVEMDDFGSGYSSLNMLKDMPLDVIKVDMMFLRKTPDENKAQIILSSIMKLMDELGIPSLTEGVETESQYQMLLGMGCKLFQGYYFSKPLPVKDFEAQFLNQERPEVPAADGNADKTSKT